MSTLVIVLIAIGVLAVLAALYFASRRQTAQKREDQRVIASEHRQEAELNRLDAEKESAIAEEQAAAARRQAAEAEQRAHSAQIAQLRADAHAEHAEDLDPDADPDRNDFDERQEVFDGERDGLYTGERPPVEEPEPARRQG
jgi:FtsZ-interacting cell division protein ZipA